YQSSKTPPDGRVSGSTRLVLHVTNSHPGAMALKLISSQSGDSTDAIEVTEREPISRDEIRCSCGRSFRLPSGVNRTVTGRRAAIREAPPSLGARRFFHDTQLKLVERRTRRPVNMLIKVAS